ncbi:hypothetical protein DTO006G1_8075 [Penicillium roqueforti]|uniref:uncharacterized protein n=1 Tax=Penicillium roqueforti TaxID=5082 RepID=UPI0019097FC1|nr:uncharacterized protein LCP9604111_6472 [Penicillium roqueforti]KAF9246712.1 hypothetical protein LCP9604111_6472 [Penicillium roqueforti]KAI1832469.1 hypothetical protein CBS147337_6727 [Penicillium roqueforti]KAI2676151.1 hypothetical protein LCP963914a_8396 [Penicillium roqueforti]KAI2683369.1 hypothetical protein CBS147355_2509 [Penicillium roqueforti]KAI2714500.1 hypothetical protein CBS147318_6654 [Penicillium roqueforti]
MSVEDVSHAVAVNIPLDLNSYKGAQENTNKYEKNDDPRVITRVFSANPLEGQKKADVECVNFSKGEELRRAAQNIEMSPDSDATKLLDDWLRLGNGTS